MKARTLIVLLLTHGLVTAIGFAAGIYALPILIAPAVPSVAAVSTAAESATYKAEFRRDLKDSDALHWGEGRVLIGAASISLMGSWHRSLTTSSICRQNLWKPKSTSIV